MDRKFDLDHLELEPINTIQGKAVFKARDIYNGPERRKYQRRCGSDRRMKLRFEPGKCIERRSLSDRRADRR